jgi:hypothetical protein
MPTRLDAFAREAKVLATHSLRFQHAYQAFILGLDPKRDVEAKAKRTTCLPTHLDTAYRDARRHWLDYHSQARVLRDQQRALAFYSSAGYRAGLTLELQSRLQQTLKVYEQIRQEHLTFQLLMRDQLETEVRQRGCDPQTLLSTRNVASAAAAVARVAGGSTPTAETKAGPAVAPVPETASKSAPSPSTSTPP